MMVKTQGAMPTARPWACSAESDYYHASVAKASAPARRVSMLAAMRRRFPSVLAASVDMAPRLMVFIAVVLVAATQLAAAEPVRVIFDTDMAGDWDDVGAAAVLHALADNGEAEIVAMGVSSKNAHTAACLDAINTYYGRGDIPIGVLKGPGVEETSKYTETVAKAFPHDLASTAAAPDVIEVYRKALAAQPDGSVVFITVGYLTNARDLLQSKPDQHSPLSGVDLVKKKVKRWVCMGLDIPKGREWNIHRDAPAAIEAVRDWPTPILFSGFEIGREIMTGGRLRDMPSGSPIWLAYEKCDGRKNHESWDQTAVFVAIRGPGDLWDAHVGGHAEVLPDGSNQWRDSPDRGHAYLVRKKAPAEVAAVIEALMLQPPKHRGK
jgi:purine nucleosidase